MNVQTLPTEAPMIADFWHRPAVITENNFVYKSLSNWAFNVAMGCSHACRFCYVPDASANKQAPRLATYGVSNPDEQWGDYLLLRPWDEHAFRSTLRKAESTPTEKLKADGNRAVIYCSTTDAYQVIRHNDPRRQREMCNELRTMVRNSLKLIRDESSLRVRILTRSPLARTDFDLFKSFGNRLLFGMSLPTLRNDLAKVYEPKAPAPSQRLETLRAAKAAGLHVYVAVAPTYPECGEEDLANTLAAVAELEPLTVFHEPINIRAENVDRIRAHADALGVRINTAVFVSSEAWRAYALKQLSTVEQIAADVGLSDCLHLWPDASLGTKASIRQAKDPASYQAWLNNWWHRVSEWQA